MCVLEVLFMSGCLLRFNVSLYFGSGSVTKNVGSGSAVTFWHDFVAAGLDSTIFVAKNCVVDCFCQHV
jgi:hypothetical protein